MLVVRIGRRGVIDILAVSYPEHNHAVWIGEDGKNDAHVVNPQAPETGQSTGQGFVALGLIAEFLGDHHGYMQGPVSAQPLEFLDDRLFEDDFHALSSRTTASNSISDSEECRRRLAI